MGYFLKVKEIKKGFSCIYKLNFPNGKIYIGRTKNLKRRISEHNSGANKKNAQVCDKAIKVYGKIKEVEILEDNLNESELIEREMYWIAKYNSNDKKIGYNITKGGLDREDRTVFHITIFSEEEVLDIRKRRFNGERKRDVYNNFYSDRNWGTFDSIWKEQARLDIGQQYFCHPSQTKYRFGYSLSEEEEKILKNKISKMRQEYKNGKTIQEIMENNPDFSESRIRNILNKTTYLDIEPLDYEFIIRKGKNFLDEKIIKEIKEYWMKTRELKKVYEKYPNISKKALRLILSERTWKQVKIKNYIPYDMVPRRISQEEKEEVLKLYYKGYCNNDIHKEVKISVYSVNEILKENNLVPINGHFKENRQN